MPNTSFAWSLFVYTVAVHAGIFSTLKKLSPVVSENHCGNIEAIYLAPRLNFGVVKCPCLTCSEQLIPGSPCANELVGRLPYTGRQRDDNVTELFRLETFS